MHRAISKIDNINSCYQIDLRSLFVGSSNVLWGFISCKRDLEDLNSFPVISISIMSTQFR